MVVALEQRVFADALATALADTGFDVNVAHPCEPLSVQDPQRGCVVMLDLNRLGQVAALSGSTHAPRVLVVASHVDDELVTEVLALGGAGVVSLNASLEEIRQAIVAAGDGSTVVRGAAPKVLDEREPSTVSGSHPCQALTARETSILALLSGGASTRQVATELGITTNTARTHIQNILRKLGVHSRLQAPVAAARAGIASDIR